MSKTFCVALKYYDKYEYSVALMEKLTEILDNFFESDQVVACPHCGKLYLASENALEYEMRDGDYACECMSPENQTADWGDEIAKERGLK